MLTDSEKHKDFRVCCAVRFQDQVGQKMGSGHVVRHSTWQLPRQQMCVWFGAIGVKADLGGRAVKAAGGGGQGLSG